MSWQTNKMNSNPDSGKIVPEQDAVLDEKYCRTSPAGLKGTVMDGDSFYQELDNLKLVYQELEKNKEENEKLHQELGILQKDNEGIKQKLHDK